MTNNLDPRPSSAIPPARPTIAGGAWAETLNEHPRLLGPRNFLRELSERKRDFYAIMKSLSDAQWLDKTGHTHVGKNDLLATGIIHAVEGLPPQRLEPYVRKAIEIVNRGVTNLHQESWVSMEQTVLAFDLFHELFSPDDRRRVIDWLNGQFHVYTDDEGAFHNSTLSKIHCYLRTAYGTWGDNPHAAMFRDYAIRRLYEGRVLPVLLELGQGGGYTECGWYCRHSLWHLVQGLELARRFDGYDGYAKAPAFFYHRLAYEMHQPYPGNWVHGAQRYSCEGDGQNRYSEFNEFPRLMRTVIAQYFRGSELARCTAAIRRDGASHHIRVFDFLYEEMPEESSGLRRVPLAHLARGIGKVYARSDWSDDASWLRFECGPWWNQHQHFEAGNFEIFRCEPLATESGEYAGWSTPHSANWLILTIAHNCILIHQDGEQWHHPRGAGAVMANDGGQGTRSIPVGDLEVWKLYANDMARGHIAAYLNQPEFLYVAGDCTRAYSPSKARQVLRQIVFIRPHLFVIFDSVISTNSRLEKTWLLHCQNEPVMDGCSAKIVNGRGQLHVQTLLPESPRIGKVQGYTYRGHTFEPTAHRDAPELVPQWRLEVQPSAPQEQDFFLHVLSTDGPIQTMRLAEGNLMGAVGEGWRVLLDPNGGGRLTLGRRECVLANEIVPGAFDTGQP